MTDAPPKVSGRERAQRANNEGPCPAGKCKHPPADHRPIANTKQHYCYHRDCMELCAPR